MESQKAKKQVQFQDKIEKKKNKEQEKEVQNIEIEQEEDLEFEDDIEDEFEDEEIYSGSEVGIEEEKITEKDSKAKKEKKKVTPFTQNSQNLQEGEYLEFDNSAYQMLHRATTEWPCLTVEFLIKDYKNFNIRNITQQKLSKSDYPLEIFMVAGSQAAQSNGNQLYVMKMNKLHRTQNDDDSSEDSEDDNSQNSDQIINPDIFVEKVQMKAGVNRIKAFSYSPIVALWNENGDFGVYDLTNKFQSLVNQDTTNNSNNINNNKKSKGKNNNNNNELIRLFKNNEEGFALDWSTVCQHKLASGSIDHKIYIYECRENLSDILRQDSPYSYHSGSVEDIQFSPVDEFALASCGVDRSIRVADLRVNQKNKAAINILKAHLGDVNVINWNQHYPNLIASGSDDCSFKVWDLRYVKDNQSLTDIKWHSGPITSIQFQPFSDSVVAVASEDHRLSIWDFAVENEDNNEDLDVPDQMMFLHQGLENIKELKYHPIYNELLIATGSNGVHLFKPCLDDDLRSLEEDQNMFNNQVINEKDLDAKLAQMSINK